MVAVTNVLIRLLVTDSTSLEQNSDQLLVAVGVAFYRDHSSIISKLLSIISICYWLNVVGSRRDYTAARLRK